MAMVKRVGGLTPGEWETLKVFQEFFEREGRPPSLREASRELGVSYERVRQRLQNVVKLGYLIKVGRIGNGVFPREALERILEQSNRQ